MTALLPWERLGGKVDERHLERLAVVYVRQSTRQQVLDHGESTRLQYGLVQRAVALGWPASRVLVIDDDLGKSGASAAGRVGVQRLVTEITMGHVGLVLGIEMSRLARSGADWYQLLELCALSGALLADADGIYDPVEFNDRLLLGLKGTMSEAELHLLKQRMLAGKQAKARRGELAIGLPTGYVRRASGEAALDPDEQAQTVVRLIFAKFAELGTLHGVLRWLVDHDVELGMRLHAGPDKGELVWRRPNRMTLQNILHSPVYAGIYAYGRRRVDPRRQLPGRPSTGRVVRAEQEWLVAIPGVLPAYITVEAYHANLARLAANAARAETPGVARAGSALLSGLARCGRCGRRLTVRYHLRAQAAVRKQLIRALVAQVLITPAGTSERVAAEIAWAGARTTHAETVRPVARLDQLSSYPQLRERVRQLAEQGHRAKAIADRLHAEGFRPAKGRQRIGISAITQLLHQLGYPRAVTRARIVPPPGEEPGPHEWWLDDLAAELGMPPITLNTWIRRGWVHARQESRRPHRWIIHADGDQLAELRQRRSRPPGWYTRRRWADSAPPAQDGSRAHAASSRI